MVGGWTRGTTIGRGSSATVSLATAVATGELFAVKSKELSCSSLLQKEQSLLSQFNSPYIVKYVGSDITIESGVGSVYNLLMEYFPGGTLTDLIKNQGGWLPESTIQLYCHQILKGLEYLHMNGVAHCDIKSQNILIGEDGVKIADLGCAKKMMAVEEDGIRPKIISGTPIFMAPEVARGEEQGFPADIWAFGCTIIEMATGVNPWPELNDPVSALYRIGYSTDVPEFPRCFSGNAREFLSNCLKRDPKERWTAKQLLQHPFLQEIESKPKPIFFRNSPTSILDQEWLWDSVSMEVSDKFSQNLSSFSSPTDRIKNLIGVGEDGFSNLPNWTDDGQDWVTVRSIFREEIPQMSEKNEDPVEASIAMEIEISPFSDEDLTLLNSSIDFENLYIGIEEHVMMYYYSDDILKDAFVSKILDSLINFTDFTASIIFKLFFLYLLSNFLNFYYTNSRQVLISCIEVCYKYKHKY